MQIGEVPRRGAPGEHSRTRVQQLPVQPVRDRPEHDGFIETRTRSSRRAVGSPSCHVTSAASISTD